MKKDYNHLTVEKKWQKEWVRKKVFQAKDLSKKKKFYGLIEFPYPSGDGLHVGHIRSNTAMDIIARKRRAQGFNVLYPIGWDAFGLPTENYSIKTGIPPAVVTKKNTDIFRRQLQALGFSFDWSREVNTTDPKYFKWTQWIFLQLLKHDLAYKDRININWCPKDKIGLANEEVVDGCCERCGTKVEKREKEQWMLRITRYADRLDKDLDTVDYLEKIKIQQRNWIGKSEGSEIDFDVWRSSEKIKVFTTRPDTIFGATYLVLAPEHGVIEKLWPQIENKEEVLRYFKQIKDKTEIERTKEEKDKTGVEIKGIHAVNPANNEQIPVWIADYVLASYGTGAIMAVPAHDERDGDFAKKYNIKIKNVIEPLFVDKTIQGKVKDGVPFVERSAVMAIVKHWSEDKYIGLKWKKVDWRTLITGAPEEGQSMKDGAISEIIQETGYLHPKFIKNLGKIHSKFYHVPKKVNRLAHFETMYFELQDGKREEMSMEEQAIHEVQWLSKKEMMEFLSPEAHKYAWQSFLEELTYSGDGILINSGKFSGMDSEKAKAEITRFVRGKVVTKYKLRDWVFSRQRYWGEPIPVVHCEKCGVVPLPEKELPLKLPKIGRYEPTDTGESPLASISSWVNTKCPKCKGFAKRETDTMPNWAGSSWYFLRYTDPKNSKKLADPKKLKYFMPVDWYNGGMEHTTLHLLYSRFWNKFLYDIKLVPFSEPYKKRTSHGLVLAKGGEKMSKSKGNVINPDEIVKHYGADTLRMYEMFMGPFSEPIAWNEDNIFGVRRFLERVWRIKEKVSKKGKSQDKFEILLNKTVKKVSDDIETMAFNTAVSSMMILLNEMEKFDSISKKDFEIFLKILSPFAPHITEELWRELGHKNLLALEAWPKADPKKLQEVEVKMAIQINGKVRGECLVTFDMTEEQIVNMAKEVPGVDKWLIGKPIQKVIFVKNRLVNFVIG
ncbi:MAG: leucyl-tRNA synthetase [Parcubacteria group bacterium Gr01-1014_46]|nr:MAG: leucyl-tRNA synthetase [Parcubacteria group bacterium Gr01-1014_46]